MTTIGQRLRALRIQKNLSQEEMAKLLDVERSTYVKYENDKNKPSRKLAEIAKIFNVTTDYILGRTESPKTVPSSPPRQLTLAEREQAIKDWLTTISRAAGNEAALAAIERIKLVESTGELQLEDGSDLGNAMLQLQAASLLSALETAAKEGTTKVEWKPTKE